MTDNSTIPSAGLQSLLTTIGQLIAQARKQAARAVDVIQVQTCWDIGRHIVEFELGGAARAAYGQRLLLTLAHSLMAHYGKGFDVTNLRHMRAFYLAFPIRDALRRELSWTHYRTLLKLDNPAARTWYMNEAAGQNWSTRALERQVGTLYYERLLASRDRAAVEQEENRSNRVVFETAKSTLPVSEAIKSKHSEHHGQWIDEIFSELLGQSEEKVHKNSTAIDEVLKQLSTSQVTRLSEAIDGLGKLFGRNPGNDLAIK